MTILYYCIELTDVHVYIPQSDFIIAKKKQQQQKKTTKKHTLHISSSISISCSIFHCGLLHCEKAIKYSASLAFYRFSSTRFINSIKLGHACKIPYVHILEKNVHASFRKFKKKSETSAVVYLSIRYCIVNKTNCIFCLIKCKVNGN